MVQLAAIAKSNVGVLQVPPTKVTPAGNEAVSKLLPLRFCVVILVTT